MTKEEIPFEYPLIPMHEIRDEVRKLAVSWAEANKYDWIGDKHKLASDIQNYANQYAQQQVHLALEKAATQVYRETSSLSSIRRLELKHSILNTKI